mmetsp:Transcript_3359/g.7954  ORF Transcript_3359/g.7954 Transcript_3359/m.7954 type:complete len:140 (-) Transcript_3359:1353-1772(-)
MDPGTRTGRSLRAPGSLVGCQENGAMRKWRQPPKKQSPTRHSSESMIPPLPSWMGGTPEPPPETAPLSYHQASALTGRALLNKDPPSHAELCGCLGPRKAQAKKVPGDLDLLPSSSGYQEEYPPPLPIQSDNVQAALAV